MPYAYYILHTKTISLSMETSTWMHNSAVRFKEWYYTNYAGNILTRCYIIQYIIHITCIIKYNYALSITSKNIISIIIQSCTALYHGLLKETELAPSLISWTTKGDRAMSYAVSTRWVNWGLIFQVYSPSYPPYLTNSLTAWLLSLEIPLIHKIGWRSWYQWVA